MHASSGQENITCGETARGPKEGGADGRGGEESEEERLEGNSEGRGAKGAEQQKGIERKVKREWGTILERNKRMGWVG